MHYGGYKYPPRLSKVHLGYHARISRANNIIMCQISSRNFGNRRKKVQFCSYNFRLVLFWYTFRNLIYFQDRKDRSHFYLENIYQGWIYHSKLGIHPWFYFLFAYVQYSSYTCTTNQTTKQNGDKKNKILLCGLKRTGRTILINLCGGSSVRLFHSL